MMYMILNMIISITKTLNLIEMMVKKEKIYIGTLELFFSKNRIIALEFIDYINNKWLICFPCLETKYKVCTRA